MSNDFDYATDQLTDSWTDVLSPGEAGTYRPVEHEPLLDMLRTAVASSTGRTSSGRSDDAARNVINLYAFAVWERINGQARTILKELGQDYSGDLKPVVRRLHDSTIALWNAGGLPEQKFVKISWMVNRWAAEIWELFDPPVIKEIVAPCPACNARELLNADGERITAVVASYSRGFQPYARCRECGATWEGERALVELGYSIKANVDADTLRDMGVL